MNHPAVNHIDKDPHVVHVLKNALAKEHTFVLLIRDEKNNELMCTNSKNNLEVQKLLKSFMETLKD